MISIVTCTARREPKFDWLADSIWRSANAKPIEWIVVDALLWTQGDERRQALLAAVKDRFPLHHLPPKPCRWQGPDRLTRSDHWALNNARNTGIIVANGERVVMLDDCCVVDQAWLAGHDQPMGGVAGSFFTYMTAVVRVGQVVEGDPGPYGIDPRVISHPNPMRCNGAWGYGLNTSFPLAAAVQANGFDELYDGAAGSEDNDAGIRFERTGCPYWWAPGCRIYQVLETHEPVGGHVGWGGKPQRSPKELQLKTGRVAFANEKLIEQLIEEPGRYLPKGNAFDMVEMRWRWRCGGGMKHDAWSYTDWRDGQRLTEME